MVPKIPVEDFLRIKLADGSVKVLKKSALRIKPVVLKLAGGWVCLSDDTVSWPCSTPSKAYEVWKMNKTFQKHFGVLSIVEEKEPEEKTVKVNCTFDKWDAQAVENGEPFDSGCLWTDKEFTAEELGRLLRGASASMWPIMAANMVRTWFTVSDEDADGITTNTSYHLVKGEDVGIWTEGAKLAGHIIKD